MIQFRCEQCGKQLKVSSTMAGNFVPCPSCKALVQTPMPDDDTDTGDVVVMPSSSRSRPNPLKTGPAILIGAILFYIVLALCVWFLLLNPGTSRFTSSVPMEEEMEISADNYGEPFVPASSAAGSEQVPGSQSVPETLFGLPTQSSTPTPPVEQPNP